ncbi:MAG: hypothetical protein JSU63_14620 [Phycisphaerales bacterium]|nr:MAG: hypothetical protein JSU63_14620 [Phycisphaerales bacterium]
MTTVGISPLSEAVDSLNNMIEEALENGSAEQFQAVETQLSKIEAAVRELQQSMWANEAKDTIRRLEKGQDLTPIDMEVIRTFIISDAEHYLAQENNYTDWLNELHRLMDDIRDRVDHVDQNSVGELRGVLKDAIRLVPDIRNYLDEHARIEKFDLAARTLDKPARDMLAQVLKDQLRNPNR